MLNQSTEAQALENWLLLEMITTGRVDVCVGEEESRQREREQDHPPHAPSAPTQALPSPTCSSSTRSWYL